MGCARALPEPPALHVLDWSGKDGRPVALDQDLLIRFDADLRLPIRPSAVRVVEAGGRRLAPFEIEAQGSLLRLRPRLPRSADLQDGALPPARSLHIELAGIPSLQALSAENGAQLRGLALLELRTLGVGEAAALAGFPIAAGVVHLLDHADGAVVRYSSRPGQAALAHFAAGLDPRTLAEDPVLWVDGAATSASQRPVRAHLIENRPEGAVVELELGDWMGWGSLEWPSSWQALGGYPIAEPHRRMRIWRGP